MKFELYDGIELNCETAELAACGIHRGYDGIAVNIGQEKSLVVFYNPDDLGDYAFAWVENEKLNFQRKLDEPIKAEMEAWFKKQDPAKKPRFREKRLQELDMVKVLVEKSEYAKYGVHKGMVGTILDPRKIGGKWLVFFPDETGADTIDSPILETDLELVFRPGAKKET